MREAKVLLVEGRSTGKASMEPALTKVGYEVVVAHTAKTALELVAHDLPDLVVFDASSMRSSGIRTTKRIRNTVGDTPIIHSRAAGWPEDRSAEADVYLVKPFTGRKLLNRIKSLLPADDLKEEIVRAGDLTFYLSKRSVDVAGKGEHRLTPKLASLLEEFLRHQNEVVDRKDLMQKVWNTSYFGDTRTLDVHVRWMREVIEDNPANPRLLKTIRGVGYIFSIPQR
jgi:DNA-binding response OmpR family regulator